MCDILFDIHVNSMTADIQSQFLIVKKSLPSVHVYHTSQGNVQHVNTFQACLDGINVN